MSGDSYGSIDGTYAFNVKALTAWQILQQATNNNVNGNNTPSSVHIEAFLNALSDIYYGLQWNVPANVPTQANNPQAYKIYSILTQNCLLTGANKVGAITTLLPNGTANPINQTNVTMLMSTIGIDPAMNDLFSALNLGTCYRDVCNSQVAGYLYSLQNSLDTYNKNVGDANYTAIVANNIIDFNSTTFTDPYLMALKIFLNTTVIPGLAGNDLLTLAGNAKTPIFGGIGAMQVVLNLLGETGGSGGYLSAFVYKVLDEEYTSEGYKNKPLKMPGCCPNANGCSTYKANYPSTASGPCN
jgi:hypothetical protein